MVWVQGFLGLPGFESHLVVTSFIAFNLGNLINSFPFSDQVIFNFLRLLITVLYAIFLFCCVMTYAARCIITRTFLNNSHSSN